MVCVGNNEDSNLASIGMLVYPDQVPYKHSTSGPPAGLQEQAATGWQVNPYPLGAQRGLQGGPPADHQQQATTEPTLVSSCPPLCLLMFCLTGFGGQQLTSRQLTFSVSTLLMMTSSLKANRWM